MLDLTVLIWFVAAGLSAPVAVVATMAMVQIDRFKRYHRHKGNPPPAITARSVQRELAAVAQVGWWTVAAALSDPLRTPVERTGPPVLCVHGYSQNATNLWGIRRALDGIGRPTVGVSLRHRIAPLAKYADNLEAAIDEVRGAEGPRFDVVAHSMGGIVLRMVLARRPDLHDEIGTVITLGSPHRGTAAVRGMGFLPELRDLARGSELLRALPRLRELLPEARLVTVAGTSDTVVYPTSSSLEHDADAVLLRDVGHAGLLVNRRAIAAVRSALRERAAPADAVS